MNRKLAFLFVFFVLLAGGLLLATAPVEGAPDAQVYYYTPTAEANGNIYYVVREGDTCISISLLNNITEDTLRALNKLNVDDCRFLQQGRKLLIGSVTPVTPTIGPSPTPGPQLPTPTPFNGNGQICVMLFEDSNGNGTPDGTETAIGGGVVSLTNRSGLISKTLTTQAGTAPILDGTTAPVCFEEIPEGDYNLSIAPPQGYNPTTSMNYALHLKAGDQSTLDFGAQPNSSTAAAETSTGSGNSVLLLVLGVVVVLAGVGLGIYASRLTRH